MIKILLTGLCYLYFPIFAANSCSENSLRIAIKTAQDSLNDDSLHQTENKLEFIKNLSSLPLCEDSFHVVDVGSIADRYDLWQDNLPNVTPYYAIKTNNDIIITSVLANLGICFDCASKNEIEQILNLNVDPSKIVFAHPRKSVSSLNFAKENKVDLLTFDSIEELEKILTHYPEAKLLLRIKTDDAMSLNPLSKKFGASLEDSYKILNEGFSKNARIIGIAFHVGSNCEHLISYKKAIVDAKQLFDYSMKKWNKKLTLLDIGGGWSGTDDLSFIRIAKSVNQLLEDSFPKDTKFIAEPGRFFSTKTTTLAMKILGKHKVASENKINYYMGNGAYGFFSASIYYAHNLEKILSEGWIFKSLSKDHSLELFNTLMWGPTCDSEDKIADGIFLPEMETDDFIIVENTGSYTKVLETSFNGFPSSKGYYFYEAAAGGD